MRSVVRLLLALGVVALIVVLRETTMTRHTPVARNTEMHTVVAASSNVAEANIAEMVDALFLVCQLEVATDPVGPATDLGSDRYLLRVRPALDESDQRQLVGCLEDARIDRLQVRVVSMEAVPREG